MTLTAFIRHRPATRNAARRMQGHMDVTLPKAALALLYHHLANTLAGRADSNEQTGPLTHHVVMEEWAWDFVASLIARTQEHPDVRWPNIAAIFDPMAGEYG